MLEVLIWATLVPVVYFICFELLVRSRTWGLGFKRASLTMALFVASMFVRFVYLIINNGG